MRILTLASQKGGTGKTTLAAHLAVEAERSKAGPVAVIDTDPQGSLAAWWNTREAAIPLFAAVNIAQLTDHVQRLRQQGIKLVIIDTPPQTLDTINNANAVADFVLIPARPSPHDLRAVAAVVEMVEQAKKPFCFVINGATPRSIIAKQAVSALGRAWQGGTGDDSPAGGLCGQHDRWTHSIGACAGIALRQGNYGIM